MDHKIIDPETGEPYSMGGLLEENKEDKNKAKSSAGEEVFSSNEGIDGDEDGDGNEIDLKDDKEESIANSLQSDGSDFENNTSEEPEPEIYVDQEQEQEEVATPVPTLVVNPVPVPDETPKKKSWFWWRNRKEKVSIGSEVGNEEKTQKIFGTQEEENNFNLQKLSTEQNSEEKSIKVPKWSFFNKGKNDQEQNQISIDGSKPTPPTSSPPPSEFVSPFSSQGQDKPLYTITDAIEAERQKEREKAQARIAQRDAQKMAKLSEARHRQEILNMERLKKETWGLNGKIPLIYQPFFSSDSSRSEGKWSSSTKILIKGQENKVSEIHLVVLFSNVIMGGIGGLVTGLESGYFAMNRLPAPNVPFPPKLFPTAYARMQYGLAASSVGWRVAKRATISGLLFDLLEKNFERQRESRDWKNSAYAGLVSGTVFGLRGGLRSCLAGAAGFGAFGSLVGICFNAKSFNKSN